MKKFLLTLGVAAMALSSSAATRILYQQNFETVNSVAETGWSFGGASISIGSNPYTKFLDIQLGQNNGRSAQVTWGQDIFLNEGESVLEDGVYNMEFDFQIVAGSTNQYNGCLTVFTNHAPVTNQPYRNPWSPAGYWQNYVFDMSQVNGQGYQFAVNGGTDVTVTDDVASYAIDYSSPTTFSEGTWYKVNFTVDTENRSVEYSVVAPATGDEVTSGNFEVPATNVADESLISMFAEGMFIMCARYQTRYYIDNISITTETSYDWANAPTISLTALGQTADGEENLNLRGYTIYFNEGETLHVEDAEGNVESVDYDDCEGAYVYETTVSGILKAWTTYGDATSTVVETVVDCTPVVLPAAKAKVSAVNEGYGKTYTLSVDNADVPMRPDVFISYEFTGVNGEKIEAEDQTSGCTLTVTEAGTLTITTAAFGYKSTTIEVKNDSEFEVKNTWDFARLTKDEIVEHGFPNEWTVLNSDTQSGFSNWTARRRLYYTNGTEEKEVDGELVQVPVQVFPFGFISVDNTVNVIEYSTIANPENAGRDIYFKGLSIFPEKGKKSDGNMNLTMLYRIGLLCPDGNNNNNNVYILDLDETDFVVVNYINNYGGNSNHPECASDEEYYKLLEGENAVYSVAEVGVLNAETNLYDVTHSLFRIDTCIPKITVFQPAGKSAVEGVEAAEVEGDNWYYSIDGVRMAEPTRPGIYIHNGKKVIVK